MDTKSYLARLEALLEGLPSAERQYAIAYYTEYLMDADPDNIQAAMDALGTPENLAAQIKADVAMRELSGSAGTGSANWEAAGTYDAPSSDGSGSSTGFKPGSPGGSWQSSASEKTKADDNSVFKVIGIVLLAIFALPIGFPIVIAVLGLVIALFATVGSLIVAAVAVGVSLLVASVVSIVFGFIALFSHWATGLLSIGAGLILLSLTLLFNLGVYYLLRWIFKGIALLFDAIRKRLSKQPEAIQSEV
jgi:uncharacterized membrane protein